MSVNASEIRALLHEVLDERNRIDADTHRTHHDYVARLIDRDQKRAERWEKIRTHVLGWSAVSVIGGVVYLLGEGLRDWLLTFLRVKGGP